MKRFMLAALLAALSLTSVAQSVSDADRKKMLDMLNQSMAKLKVLTGTLSETQVNFKPAEGRWSIKNNVDHLVIVEKKIWDIFTKALKEPGNGQESSISDEAFISMMSTREKNFKAPDYLQPSDSNYPDFDAALKDFTEKRNRTIFFASTTKEDLRGHFAKMGTATNLDACQWVMYAAAHCYRHIEQVEEIIAHKNFPDK